MDELISLELLDDLRKRLEDADCCKINGQWHCQYPVYINPGEIFALIESVRVAYELTEKISALKESHDYLLTLLRRGHHPGELEIRMSIEDSHYLDIIQLDDLESDDMELIKVTAVLMYRRLQDEKKRSDRRKLES